MPKLINVKPASTSQIKMLLKFAEMTNTTRKQMALNAGRRSVNGFYVAMREEKLSVKSIEDIIEGERKRLAPFLKERDVAKAYHILQQVTPLNPSKLEKILIEKEGGKKGVVAWRIRERGLTLEQKQIVCEHQANMINQAFDYVDFTPLN